MHSQDIPREIVRVRREKETYVHAFVTVPVWHNPRYGQGHAPLDHLTTPGRTRAARRSRRVAVLLCLAAVLVALGFGVSCVVIPADAVALRMFLNAAVSCFGAAVYFWAHVQLSRTAPPRHARCPHQSPIDLPGGCSCEQPAGPAFRERA
ncbi:hypothetical protein ACIP17_23530 [Streptomyces iakyrus]|uniref:Integral membrane protein n=1 Tax=Streptomyces iakyrus TaxID=68219 RepID=A0ABW8FGU5_9ACTN